MRPLSLIAVLGVVISITTAFVLVETTVSAKTSAVSMKTSMAVTRSMTTAPTSTSTTTSTTPPRPAIPVDVLSNQVVTTVQKMVPGAKVGLLVVDRNTGQPVASFNADQQFYSASVVKLLIALDVINSDNGNLDQSTEDELHQLLAYSDDGIADSLWDDDGGDSIVTRMATLIGLSGTSAPDDPTQWGETLLTAQDVVATYHYITDTLPEPGRDVIMNALSQAGQTAADGFDQYFGIPDGLSGSQWAIKQGWMPMDTSIVLNTTGLVGPNLRYAVALLTSLPADTSWSTGSKALTAATAALSPVITS